MSTIIPFLKNEAFDQRDIEAMSMALDDICKVLKIDGNKAAREVIAIRIVELARRGERSATTLRNRLYLRQVAAVACSRARPSSSVIRVIAVGMPQEPDH